MEEVVAHLFSPIFHSFLPSEADYLVPERFSFYGVRLLESRPTSNLEDQGIPLFIYFFYLVGWDLTSIRSLCRSPRFV
jgi:hypothetical protein